MKPSLPPSLPPSPISLYLQKGKEGRGGEGGEEEAWVELGPQEKKQEMWDGCHAFFVGETGGGSFFFFLFFFFF